MNARPEGNPSGQAHVGLFRVGGPTRTPSIAVEMSEEQQITNSRLEKLGQKIQDKKIKELFFDRFDALNGSWPFIFIGRECFAS